MQTLDANIHTLGSDATVVALRADVNQALTGGCSR
jgi:hypothetical protein